MFRAVAKWGGVLAKTVAPAECRIGVNMVSKAVQSSSLEMPWNIRAFHSTVEAHKPAMPIHLEALQPETPGVAEQLRQLFALEHTEQEGHSPSDIAFARLSYLTSEVSIRDSNDAWDEVYSCLQLVSALPQNIQYGLLSAALERHTDDAVIATIKNLLQLGININAQDAGGNSALYLASTESSQQVLSFLLDNRADITAKTITGESIIDVATKRLVHEEEGVILPILESLAASTELGGRDCQAIHDMIIGTGVENAEEAGIEIMGADMWQLCEEGASDPS